MKKYFGFILSALLVLTAVQVFAKDKTQDLVYKFKAKTIDGKMVSLSRYKGKVLLVVNVASKCGHTPQYKGLEKLYEKYRGQGFEILGFPCNQFKEQEPGSDKDIQTFCNATYGVKFPMFSKIEVNGEKAHPLYKFLKTALPGDDGKGDIGWNFTKFLIDKEGRPLKRFSTAVEPEGVEEDLKSALK